MTSEEREKLLTITRSLILADNPGDVHSSVPYIAEW